MEGKFEIIKDFIVKGFLALLVVTLFVYPTSLYAAETDELQSSVKKSLATTYRLVIDVERRGGDVAGLILKLNDAATLLNIGDLESLNKATILIGEVAVSIHDVEISSIQSTTIKYIVTGGTLITLFALGLAVYLYGSKVFWLLWLKSKKSWRTEPS